jgi:DNA-binding response OmpR family regulator
MTDPRPDAALNYSCSQLPETTVPERLARILLVDDEQSIQTLLSYPLRKEGYDVVQATDGRQALERFDEQQFDLVVLDLMLPRIDGLEVCRRLRSRSSVPIIMLTAKSEEIDKVVGLELGADDYITKPFSLREFSSRIKAALRRAEMSRPDQTMPGEEPLEIRALRIDFAKRTVRIRGDEAQLTYVEFEILSALARAPGRVFTRDMLLARIWGDSAYRDPRTIDVHIRHLREKVERDSKDPEYLFTVRGVGYRFRDTDPA